MTEGSRVPGAADPATTRVLIAARSTARELSDELLTHLPDLGHLPTQRALDVWVEQAADTLRALSEALEERLLDLGTGPASGHASATRPTPAGAAGTSVNPMTQGDCR
jgi:hypothetical protein